VSQVNFRAAWGDGEELWVAGERGTILHFDGSEWHPQVTGTSSTLNAIFGLAPNDIWAVGDDGTALHFDGNAWSPVGAGGYQGSFQAVWAAAAGDVWVGGQGGMFRRTQQ